MKSILLTIYLLLISLSFITAQQKNSEGNNIKELMEIEWNTEDGITLKDYPEGRLGIADYEFISYDEVAFLCKVEKKIKIFNIKTGLITNQFTINHYPRRFTYDSTNRKFYVLDHGKVYEYSLKGGLINSFEINKEFKFFERLESFNGNVYLLSANQYTFQLTINGVILSTDEQLQSRITGWILNENLYGRTNIKDAHTYSVEIRNKQTIVTKKDFSTVERIDVGTIRLIGSSGNLFYLMLDYVLQENPPRAGRRLIVFSRDTESIIQQIDLPRITYTDIRNDITSFGEKVFHLLTTPENAVIFELGNESFSKEIVYPEKYNYFYHFGNSKLPRGDPEIIDKTTDTTKQSYKSDPTNSSIMGSQIIDRAYNYMQLSWIASQYNIAEPQGTNVQTIIQIPPGSGNYYSVETPGWISSSSNNTTTPYKWGGWTHFDDFVPFALNASPSAEIFTGDISTDSPYETSDEHVIGLDCSGFVTRAWNREPKLSTGTIPGVSNSISYSKLERGECIELFWKSCQDIFK